MRIRRLLAAVLVLLGLGALFLASVEVGYGLQGSGGAWIAAGVLLLVAAACLVGAVRLACTPRSTGAVTGHVVLWETPMQGVTLSSTPALTIRGARDAVERFIPLAEFDALFGGWAMWGPPANPTPELPGEAIGVWSRRTCSRFRRVLRERGATVEVRREPGPAQSIVQLHVR